jgi:hypothetical protein
VIASLSSAKLKRALEVLAEMHVIVREDSMSPWIEIDVNVRGYCLLKFGIWKETDELYAEEPTPQIVRNVIGPAMGEEPYDVERLAELDQLERRPPAMGTPAAPEGFEWGCESCGYHTADGDEAGQHSDWAKHSLALRPLP